MKRVYQIEERGGFLLLHREQNEIQNDSDDIAPSLMMSGTFGKPTSRIKDSFECRYFVNFIDNLFEDVSVRLFLSKYGIDQIATLGKKCDKAPMMEKPSAMAQEVKDII